MVNTILELFVLILSCLSIFIGILGLITVAKCKVKRIKPAIISVQVVAVLLAIAHAALQYTKGIDLEYTIVIYLALNSSFLLLVQVVALLLCQPKSEVKDCPKLKARVKVSGNSILK
jgi:predicted ferric reductase